MTNLMLTQHAARRMTQRSIAADDLELIFLIGTEVEGGFLVRKKDCQAAQRQLKDLMERVGRLAGKRAVIVGDHVVTAYHALDATKRRLLRNARQKDLIE